MASKIVRRYPVGAEVQPSGGTHFSVWAPKPGKVELLVENGEGGHEAVPMKTLHEGYRAAFVPWAGPGSRYRFRLDGGQSYPDPASRHQPDGPHGASQVVDPSSYRWRDGHWRGIGLKGQVLYEMHIGTFTREGTWAAAAGELAELAACGITVIEVMPVADFPGRFGWGYDGVGLFAPVWLYGEPDDFRRFVDKAHGQGLGVILDVVYNHLGPNGNYLHMYSDHYFSTKYKNEWGEPINFDGEHSGPVREFFLANTGYWIEEYHLDGLRLDATQQMFDASANHVIGDIGRRVRQAAHGRATLVIAENESQETRLVRPEDQGGLGLDAIWNDDFHHSARVAMTGLNEAYYMDYCGKPQEFLSMFKHGFLYQGQRYEWQRKRRGSPSIGVPPERFVVYLQNHDQVANSGRGERIHFLTSPGRYRAMTALLLLSPCTPLLFQGQEFGATAPFHYFSDHVPELSKLVREGRTSFMHQFRSLATPGMQPLFQDPGNPSLFESCKLDFGERVSNRHIYNMHKDLLRLRREDAVFSSSLPGCLDGAVLAEECFVLRYFASSPGGVRPEPRPEPRPEDDRLLVVNLGRLLRLNPAPEPLLAPPEGRRWRTLWSSEDPRYGGSGTPQLDTDENWIIPGHAAVALRAAPKEP